MIFLAISWAKPGGRAGPASTSTVGFQETERLLDESDWATGASSWRLGAPQAEDPGDWAAAAAATGAGELLSLVRTLRFGREGGRKEL